MHILLGSDIKYINFTRECANSTRNMIAMVTMQDGITIQCIIGARVLLKNNSIDPLKTYKFFVLDSDLQKEGQVHYINQPRITDNSSSCGFSINETTPILGSNRIVAKDVDVGKNTTCYSQITDTWYYKEWSPEVIIGYQGTFTGIFKRFDAFIPGISDYTVTIQPLYKPGDQLLVSEIGVWKKGYGHICWGNIAIPINSDYIESISDITFIEGKKYTFDCKFGNDEGWGYIGYKEYAKFPYLSGLITDEDFDPQKDYQ